MFLIHIVCGHVGCYVQPHGDKTFGKKANNSTSKMSYNNICLDVCACYCYCISLVHMLFYYPVVLNGNYVSFGCIFFAS